MVVGAGLVTYASVRFLYELRPDVVPVYQGGAVIKSTQRLIRVQEYSGENLVQEYRLSYDQSPSTKRSRVINIARCAAGGACLPGHTFSYQEAGTNFALSGTLSTPFGDADESASGQRWFIMDVDGDGRKDMVIRDQSGGFHIYHANGVSFSAEVYSPTDANGNINGVFYMPPSPRFGASGGPTFTCQYAVHGSGC